MMSSVLRSLAAGTLWIVFAAAPAFAQAQQGDKEVLLNGDMTTAFGGGAAASATTGNVSTGLGYYFTQAVEVFGALNVGFSRDALAGTDVDAGMGLAFRYNFARPARQTVPYVGVQYALNSFKNAGDSSYIQPNAGFKYYLQRNTAFDVNISYGHALSSSGGGSIIRESFGLVFGF
jgi:hypothetical protein